MQATRGVRHTDIQQASTIILLVDDVLVEDLIVQGLWFCLGRRHGVCESVAKVRSSKSKCDDLYFAAPAMSLGTSSRGNADFGRSAANVRALIGHCGELRGPRCRRPTESARRLRALVVACYFDSLMPGNPKTICCSSQCVNRSIPILISEVDILLLWASECADFSPTGENRMT